MTKSGQILKLPSFVIAGAAKSGTTSLSRYLGEHPQIYMPDREMNYFAFARKAPHYSVKNREIIRNFNDYKAYFRFPENDTDFITGEKSVSFLYQPWCEHVIENIKSLHPLGTELKIIIILRQPVERAYSQYLFNTRNKETLPFTKALYAWEKRREKNWVPAYNYIGAGFYAQAVKAYLNNFKHVRIYLFDDLKNTPLKLLQDIYGFLGVDAGFTPATLGKAYNYSGLPNDTWLGKLYRQKWFSALLKPLKKAIPDKYHHRFIARIKAHAIEKPPLEPGLKKELITIYKEDISELEKIINRDLSSWIS
ncbi:MAG: sulfotransferase [Bacteroidales bacterium]|nr:sulfotransferase [Bacteroidales bacterium]